MIKNVCIIGDDRTLKNDEVVILSEKHKIFFYKLFGKLLSEILVDDYSVMEIISDSELRKEETLHLVNKEGFYEKIYIIDVLETEEINEVNKKEYINNFKLIEEYIQQNLFNKVYDCVKIRLETELNTGDLKITPYKLSFEVLEKENGSLNSFYFPLISDEYHLILNPTGKIEDGYYFNIEEVIPYSISLLNDYLELVVFIEHDMKEKTKELLNEFLEKETFTLEISSDMYKYSLHNCKMSLLEKKIIND